MVDLIKQGLLMLGGNPKGKKTQCESPEPDSEKDLIIASQAHTIEHLNERLQQLENLLSNLTLQKMNPDNRGKPKQIRKRADSFSGFSNPTWSPLLKKKTSRRKASIPKTNVCVLFADVVGYTSLCSNVDFEAIQAQLLDPLFKCFDRLIERYEAKKVKTVGDAYMISKAVGDNEKFTACQMIELANKMIAGAKKINLHLDHSIFKKFNLKIRVGINIGQCTQTIDSTSFETDFFGDMVNTASRMESTGKPNQVQITRGLHALVADIYEFEESHKEIKGKGLVTTYFVEANQSPTVLSRRHSFVEVQSQKEKLLRTLSIGNLAQCMSFGRQFSHK